MLGFQETLNNNVHKTSAYLRKLCKAGMVLGITPSVLRICGMGPGVSAWTGYGLLVAAICLLILSKEEADYARFMLLQITIENQTVRILDKIPSELDS